MIVFLQKEITCPFCHEVFECASNITEPDRQPFAGCINICFCCKMVSIYTEDCELRAPTPQELDALDHEEKKEIIRIQNAIGIVKNRRVK